jgi:hypothetical protein
MPEKYEIEIRDEHNRRTWQPVVLVTIAITQNGPVPIVAYIDKDSKLSLALGGQTIRTSVELAIT